MTRKTIITYAAALTLLSATGPNAALADSASCLVNCGKAFDACNKRAISTNDFKKCLEQRKKCIEGCADVPDD